VIAFDHYTWSDDGRQFVYEGQTDQNQWNVYKQAVAEGPPLLVKTDARDAYPVLSPDGDIVALREGRGGISLYRGNESQPVTLRAASENEYPIRFVKNGKALLVADQTVGELTLTVIDLASGHREPWKRIPDVYSTRANQLFVATPDLRYYAYPFPRYSSVLYAVENLH
jgi:Tol biopolymer transport system component